MSFRKRLPCEGNCPGKTEHRHLGKNSVLVDVWACTVCEERRTGILTKSDVKGRQVATDGGERDV